MSSGKIARIVGAFALMATPAAASESANPSAETGSNLKPYAFGVDQTIVDVGKVQWQPLKVKGLDGDEFALLRGSLEKGGAELLIKLPPNGNVPMHDHTSAETYVWVSGAFTLVSPKGERVKFDGPAFMSFPGNAPPHGLQCGPSAPCVFYVRYNRPFDIHYFPEPAAAK